MRATHRSRQGLRRVVSVIAGAFTVIAARAPAPAAITVNHGTKVAGLVAVSPCAGGVVSGFGHTTNGQVETLLVNGGHLLVGGYFTYINGTGRDYMASVSPTTGKDDGFLHLHISGNYHFCS